MKRFLNTNQINWVCHHLHLDKSKTITQDNLHKSIHHMKEKWILMREIKECYTYNDLRGRIHSTSAQLMRQNCFKMRTFIDVDSIVGLEPLKAALEVKKAWEPYNVELQIGTQLLEGLSSPESIQLFNEAANLVDFIGCLPSRDTDPKRHLDIVFDKASELGLDVEAHLDQVNLPFERETEMFCDFVEKYNYQGKSRAIHCISLSCQPEKYQKSIARRLKNLDIGVIVCPSAAISMKQHSNYYAPIHNSIGPVQLLLEQGVNVGLGIDNIEDIFVPFCDGNLSFELRLLAEATRIYDTEVLLKIAQNDMGFN